MVVGGQKKTNKQMIIIVGYFRRILMILSSFKYIKDIT
jgi:hypothetical protein